jgi:large subunit ribosomal protein L27
MANKKGQGSSRNGRDSNAQRLGVKRGDGELVQSGTIIVRQRGTRWQAGANVKRAGDDSLFAVATGRVHFRDRGRMGRVVLIEPAA